MALLRRVAFALSPLARAAALGPVPAPRVFAVRAFSAQVQNMEKVDEGKVTPTSHFGNDLGLDSLDTVEVCMAIEEEFCIQIPDAEAEKIHTIEDAIEFVSTHPQAK